jgi:hypothetical protein
MQHAVGTQWTYAGTGLVRLLSHIFGMETRSTLPIGPDDVASWQLSDFTGSTGFATFWRTCALKLCEPIAEHKCNDGSSQNMQESIEMRFAMWWA